MFFVAASASFNGFYDKWHFREPGVILGNTSPANGLFGFSDMVDGTASRPFVYRQLLPSIANWFDRATSHETKESIFNFVTNQGRLADIILTSPVDRSSAYFFRYLIVYVLTFLFAWLSVFAMHLCCREQGFSTVTCVFAPVLMILLIPYFMSTGGYFYDYPELAFMALAVWVGLKLDWWWMLPVVVLGTWNKESFLLMTLTLYPIIRTRHSRLWALVGAASLFLTSGAVYWGLRSHYMHNPGAAVLEQWPRQVLFLLHPSNFIEVEKTYGVLTFRPITVIPVVLIIWTVRRGWRKLPVSIQRHGKIAAAINFPLFFLFCAPGEMRDLSMLYIVFMSLMAAMLEEVAHRSFEVMQERSQAT